LNSRLPKTVQSKIPSAAIGSILFIFACDTLSAVTPRMTQSLFEISQNKFETMKEMRAGRFPVEISKALSQALTPLKEGVVAVRLFALFELI
jgi:hypothetical protein